MTGREMFLAKIRDDMSAEGLENVAAAYLFAKYGHRGEERDGGDRYFNHPRAVAEIIIEELKIRDDWQIIATALLHDILEDSWILGEHRIAINFGYNVARWVQLLTKKPKDGYLERLQRDGGWQVLLVKLADRLHNLRTLADCTEEKQRKQVLETKAHYLPLADLLTSRLPDTERWRGRHIKRELEALCRQYEAKLSDSRPTES